MKLAALVLTMTGMALAAANGGSFFSDAECREKTQYDTSTNNIVDCPTTVKCSIPGVKCERDDVVITDDDGYAITIVFCSCGDIDKNDIFEGETCHIYRWHRGAETEPRCNKEGCPADEECDFDDPGLTVVRCACA